MTPARRLAILILILTGLLPLVAAQPAVAGEPTLRSYRAEYSLRSGYLEFAEVEVVLKVSPTGAYHYSAQTTPVGLTAVLHSDRVSETSSGRISRGVVIPEIYQYRHDKPSKPRQVDLEFDWQALRVTNSTPDSRWRMKIKPRTQDKFSQQLSLMLALAGGKRQVQFPVADGGRSKVYSFHLEQEESIETAAGQFQTMKIVRSKNERPSQASLWLAPALNYLPVRVERRENDGEYVMELRSVRWD